MPTAAQTAFSVGALRFLKAWGITIPGQAGLIGFTNSGLTQYLNPSLSTIRQPASEMANSNPPFAGDNRKAKAG